MKNLLRRIPRVTERNALLLLALLTYTFIGYFSEKVAMAIMFAIVLPMMTYHAIAILRSRRFSGERIMWLMGASALWVFFTVLLTRSASHGWGMRLWFLYGCWFFVLFVPKETTSAEVHRELFSVGMLFICFYLPFELMGLYSVFTGRQVFLPHLELPIGVAMAGVRSSRLFILMNPNSVARYASFNLLFAIYGILTHRHRGLRAFLIVTIPLNLMVLSHSDSRTGMISLSFALGLIGFRWLFLRLGGRIKGALAGAAAAAVIFFVVLNGLNLLLVADVKLADRIMPLSVEVEAEASGADTISSHAGERTQFDISGNGRGELWKSAFAYLKHHPRYLITGMGGVNYYERIAKEYDIYTALPNFHSSFLHALVEYGVPFLIAMLAFLCMLVRPSIRMLLAPAGKDNRGLFIVPVFVAMIVLMSVPEEMIFVRHAYSNIVFYFFCGHVLHFERTKGALS